MALRLLASAAPADPEKDPRTWPVWRQLLPHVLVLTATHPDRDFHPAGETAAWLLDRAAGYLHARGEPTSALGLNRRAYQLYRETIGEDHPNTLRPASHLATGLAAVGEYEAARQLEESLLPRHQRIHGKDHPFTLATAHNLADHLHALGDYQRARELNEDTLTRQRRVQGEDHRYTLDTAEGLAADLHALGEYQRARELGEDALSRRRRKKVPATLTKTPSPAAAESSARTTPTPWTQRTASLTTWPTWASTKRRVSCETGSHTNPNFDLSVFSVIFFRRAGWREQSDP